MTLGLTPGQVRLYEDHQDWAAQYPENREAYQREKDRVVSSILDGC